MFEVAAGLAGGLGWAGGLARLAVAMALLLAVAPWLPLPGLTAPRMASLHVLVKMVASGLALAVSLLTWSTRRALPFNFVLAGLGFLAVALLDAAQILLLPGMPGLAETPAADLSTPLLLGADSAAVLSLFAAAMAPMRRGSARALRLGMACVAAWVVAVPAAGALAPDWWQRAAQTTAHAELALACSGFVAAPLLLGRSRGNPVGFALMAVAALLSAIGVAAGAGLSSQMRIHGLTGDGYKMLACLLVYLALFREGVQAPWHRLVASGRVVDENLRRFQQLFESTPDGLLLVGSDGRIEQANTAVASMFGWTVSELLARKVEDLLPAPMRDAHRRFRHGFQDRPRTREMGRGGALQAARRDGTEFPVEIALVPQSFADSRSTLCIVRDVTERRRLETSLMRQAMHDALTDLPNRRQFRDTVAKALAQADRHGGTLALMFIDLDNFKQVNDTLGHTEGDALLCQVARRLREALREGDLLARMGGDEFALLLQDAQGEDAVSVASKVLRVLQPEFVQRRQVMTIGASIGITMFPADGRSVDELLSNADLAMYRAKQSGRGTWCFFEQRMTEQLLERSSLRRDLAHAIERNQFELVFQPRVSARSGHTTGFESLLRWRHPERGLVPPDLFIPLAEESGLIVEIGEWVLRHSCRQAADWRAAGAPWLTLAVNVSTHQLRNPGFAASVQQALADSGWPPAQLELEITETALMEDPLEAAAQLHRISAQGVRFAVDDFGTGYSSLAYLKTFPLHRLKVDRSFVQGLQSDGSDCVIASSIIALAHALGLQVTAEGVETAAQRDFLLQRQCDELQGYLYSAPLNPLQCEAWLTRIAHAQALAPVFLAETGTHGCH